MAKIRALINGNILCTLSKLDFENLRLLQMCLPTKEKPYKDLNEEEKLSIKDYNKFLDSILDRNKGKYIDIQFNLNKIEEE